MLPVWGRGLALSCVAVVTTSGACATTFYEGPPRPAAEAAVLQSGNTVIDEIDGKDVKAIRKLPARYVLPPGPHIIGFSVLRIEAGAVLNTMITSRTLSVCFQAVAGHSYITIGPIFGSSWRPLIVDEFHADASTACEVAPASAAAGEAAEAGAVAAPDATPPNEPTAAAPQVLAMWSREKVHRPPALPRLDFTFNFGFALGGDNILTAQLSNGDTEELKAGQGGFASAGVMVTPLWLGKVVGIGVGGDIGVKYDSVEASNAGVSFTRYPAVGTAHLLLRTGEDWYVLAAGGVEKDLDISVSGSGDASSLQANLSSRNGGLGRLGMYVRFGDHVAWMFGVAYTHLTYVGPGGSADASSFGFWTNLDIPAL
jgi:hypothetical protein